MPELPDLEVFSANLHRRLAGRKLEKLQTTARAKMNVSKAALRKALEGQAVAKVYRDGKELRFAFKNGHILGMHLMLHGYLYWVAEEKPKPHTLLTLFFTGGTRLAMADFQSAARLTLDPPEAEAPDALSKAVNAGFWKKKLQSKAAIKNLLLDQHVVRGIGNAYADEILWSAGISPFSASNKIPAPAVARLAKSVRTVLKKAQKQVRKEDPSIIGGELRDFLLIHNAKKKQSPGGSPIKKKAVGGRKTYYTDEQKLYV